MSSPTYQVTDPSTGEVVETFDHATDAEIEAALAASHRRTRTWKDVPIAERAKVVKRIAALFVERADELGAIATEEMGKPRRRASRRRSSAGDLRLLRRRGPDPRGRPADQVVLRR